VTHSSSSYSPDRSTGRNARAQQSISSRLIERLLPSLQSGRLTLVLPDGATVERRGERPGPEAILELKRWRGLGRVLIEGEDGFVNGYIDGDWTTRDLVTLLELGVRNEMALTPQTKSSLFGLVHNRLIHALHANTRRGSCRNIAAHYDLGNDFFRPWLDAGMNYSSALYRDDEPLEQAQEQKLDRIGQLLALSGGEKILEIGCGWGALAEWLIRQHGAQVTGITLSIEQLGYAKSRLAGEVASGCADLRLQDYRDLTGPFDRIVSIEMIEAVGERYWPLYFAKLRDCLVSGGVAVIQAITIDQNRFGEYRKRPDFIQRRIFPGGMLPTRAIIEREAARAGLRVSHHESFGDSYARTLREWRLRFLQAWPKLEALGFNGRFGKMWEYYLAYCEVGFRVGAVDVGLYKLAG